VPLAQRPTPISPQQELCCEIVNGGIGQENVLQLIHGQRKSFFKM